MNSMKMDFQLKKPEKEPCYVMVLSIQLILLINTTNKYS